MSVAGPRARALIRPRVAGDLPALGQVLTAQQPHSGYPQTWPSAGPAEEFLTRPGELVAFVAEAPATGPTTLGPTSTSPTAPGRVCGHVSVTRVEPSPEADGWAAGTGRPLAELAAVSVLFVDHEMAGQGVGGALLDAAVGWIREHDLIPVLDVVSESHDAVRFYRRRGWQEIGQARPHWLPAELEPVLLMALSNDAGLSWRT